MKQFLNKIRGKKTPKTPRQPIRSKEPADVAAGPPDTRAEVDVTPDGGQSLFYESLGADSTNLTVPQNGGGGMSSRMVLQDTMDGDQELPASGASAPKVAVGGVGYGNQLASKCSLPPRWVQNSRPSTFLLISRGFQQHWRRDRAIGGIRGYVGV